MNFKEYIEWTDSTAVYPEAGTGSELEIKYLSFGFISEIGELSGLLKREIRDGKIDKEQVIYEIGDICWYFARIVKFFKEEISEKYQNMSFVRDYELFENLVYINLDISRFFYKFSKKHYGIGIDWEGVYESINIICQYFGITLESVLKLNVAKLESRKERGKLHGKGGER